MIVVLASLLVCGLLALAALDDARIVATQPLTRSHGGFGHLPARVRFPA